MPKTPSSQCRGPGFDPWPGNKIMPQLKEKRKDPTACKEDRRSHMLQLRPSTNKFFKKDTSTPMFTAALFTIARTWKQPSYPLTDEWIKKLWYIYTLEYYSAIKRNGFESVVVRRMNLESVIQSKESQKEKNKYHILMHIHGI